MLKIDTILGNAFQDESIAATVDRHEASETLERVVLDASERKKSRLRVTTDAGTDLGILVDRDELTAGDVLYRDDDRCIVVALERREALAVELPADASPAAAAELGHRVGNQHWDLATDRGTLYVSLDADRRIVDDVLEGHLPDGATTTVETVDPSVFVDDRSDRAHGDHGHLSDEHDHVGHEHDHVGHDGADGDGGPNRD